VDRQAVLVLLVGDGDHAQFQQAHMGSQGFVEALLRWRINEIDTGRISACTGGPTRIRGAAMTTNTVVLIIVAVAVALIVVGVITWFGVKFRAERRMLGGNGILDEVAEDARLEAELVSKAQAAQVDSEIKAFRSRGRRKESADARQTADMRAQLKNRD
jgi:hypothetical protein